MIYETAQMAISIKLVENGGYRSQLTLTRSKTYMHIHMHMHMCGSAVGCARRGEDVHAQACGRGKDAPKGAAS